jgi:arylsulfatase A
MLPVRSRSSFQYGCVFNLRRDIGQDRDVAAKHPEVFAEMKRKMTELHAEVVEEAPDWRAWKW